MENEKFYYNPTFEAKEQVPVFDDEGKEIGIETIVKGRILKKVWTDEEELKKEYRLKREPILDAFDKWEKAVLRGREQDDFYIMSWYRDLLDLKNSAFVNIPARIKYYM